MVATAEDILDLGLMGPQLVYEDLEPSSQVAVPGLTGEVIPGSGRSTGVDTMGPPDGIGYRCRHHDPEGRSTTFMVSTSASSSFEDIDFLRPGEAEGLSGGVFPPGPGQVHLQGRTVGRPG